MTQEDKELLLKDLSARLPYGVKAYVKHWSKIDRKYYEDTYDVKSVFPSLNEVHAQSKSGSVDVLLGHSDYNIKPYLFPLSSMTEEQYKEWCDLEEEPLDEILTRNANGEKMSTLEHHLLIAKSLTDSVNYCYKNHFDIYGLIPKGLAIDATRLNVY